MSVRANFADLYLRGMRDGSERSGTEYSRGKSRYLIGQQISFAFVTAPSWHSPRARWIFKLILIRAFFSIASTWSASVLSKGCIPMKSSYISHQSPTQRMQKLVVPCSKHLLFCQPWSWKTLHSECLQIFAACQEPLPLAAHSESLVMSISHLFSEVT